MTGTNNAGFESTFGRLIDNPIAKGKIAYHTGMSLSPLDCDDVLP